MFKARQIILISAAIILARLITLFTYPILDKSEARYAYIGELMVQTGNWVTPFIDHGVPFWAKPILSFWMTALSFTAFGFNAFAARLPAFLIFGAVGLLIFILGRDRGGKEFGLAAACVFATTALAFYLGGTVMTDPALMLGVALTMTSYWKCVGPQDTGPPGESRAWGYLFFIGLTIGLLAKGPIGAILPGLSVFAWVVQHGRWAETWRRLPWISGMALTLLLTLPWYVLAEHRTPGFLRYFIVGEHFDRFIVPHWNGDLYGSGRPSPWGMIWLFGVVATLPWSVTLLLFLSKQGARAQLHWSIFRDRWLSYLLFWMLGSLVLFTFAANALMSYVAPSLPAFALLTAHAFRRVDDGAHRTPFAVSAAIVPLLFLGAVIVFAVDPRSSYLRSQAGIVATFNRMTAGQPADLIYVVNKPYSADFYTGGHAKLIGSNDDIAPAIARGEQYFVVASDVYPKLSAALRQRLEVIQERNHYALLRARPATSQR